MSAEPITAMADASGTERYIRRCRRHRVGLDERAGRLRCAQCPGFAGRWEVYDTVTRVVVYLATEEEGAAPARRYTMTLAARSQRTAVERGRWPK